MGKSKASPSIALLLLMLYSSMTQCNDCVFAGEKIKVTVVDEAAFHIHPPGQSFSVRLRVETDGKTVLHYYWCDYRGLALTEPKVVANAQEVTVTCPAQTVGYYGLVVASEVPDVYLPNQQRGAPREYGFAILPQRTISQRQSEPDSPFGMVHADAEDPYLRGWVKTSTWLNRSPSQLSEYITELRNNGLEELPLLTQQEWRTDDNRPITAAELDQLSKRLKSYFQANQDVRYWELGIEENLKPFYKEPFYWKNLAAKTKAAHAASDEAGTGTKFIYQVVATGANDSVLKFLDSEAAQYFDVLSIHPYTWKTFPDPNSWLEHGLDAISSAMDQKGIQMPIWFTEVGAPQHSRSNGGCLSASETQHNIIGKSRAEEIAFMVKLHIIALTEGVEKVFWYNYFDRKSHPRDDPENYFGLRDHWGYPKSAYVAYVSMLTQLEDMQSRGLRKLEKNLRAYEFVSQRDNCYVLWTYPTSEVLLSQDELQEIVRGESIAKITGPVGNPIESDDEIRIGEFPVFVTTRPK